MGRAKEIKVKVIPAKIANEFVARHHYSKSYQRNSLLHFGCFLDGQLHGVLSYGTSIDKNNCIGLVDTGMTKHQSWHSYLELNRMAFDEYLPANSESRCIAITIKMIRRNAPHVKWILSYSDGTQCGDGAIYRASGFALTGIKKNTTILNFNGKIISDIQLNTVRPNGIDAGKAKKMGAKPLNGFQLRYIYLIDKNCKINVPIIPFSKIDEMGAGMHKGKKITIAERKRAHEVNIDKRNDSIIEIGGANPTHAL